MMYLITLPVGENVLPLDDEYWGVKRVIVGCEQVLLRLVGFHVSSSSSSCHSLLLNLSNTLSLPPLIVQTAWMILSDLVGVVGEVGEEEVGGGVMLALRWNENEREEEVRRWIETNLISSSISSNHHKNEEEDEEDDRIDGKLEEVVMRMEGMMEDQMSLSSSFQSFSPTNPLSPFHHVWRRREESTSTIQKILEIMSTEPSTPSSSTSSSSG